jgi:hypothetical protein
MQCFAHVRTILFATLRDDANNCLRFQEAEVCTKCGKVFSQGIYNKNWETGFFDEELPS